MWRRMNLVKVFPYADVEAEKADEGASRVKVRWLITKNIGAPNFAMRLFEVESGGFSPLHSHDWEHEVFILEGEGTVFGKEGEKKFKSGYVVFVPPNEKHQFKNTGKKLLRFLCLVPYHEK
jgi:quercetin dioxygenase-like cupin family protein